MPELEEITYDYEDEGRLVRRELERAVLSKGAWATVMFLYQDLDRKSGDWRAPKIAIVRLKKAGGTYRKQSSFNISSERQARQMMEVMERWYAAGGPGAVKAAAAGGEAEGDAGEE